MENSKFIVMKYLLFILFICISSCTPRFINEYYAPDEGNMVMLSHKKDLNISGSVPSSLLNDKDPEQYNFQFSYSPIKHLGLLTAYSDYAYRGISETMLHHTKLKIYNGAIGGYYLFQNKEQKLRGDTTDNLPTGILLDLYAGFGKGNLTNKYKEGGNSILDFNKYFIQGGVHYQEELVGVSAVYKIGAINYYQGVINGPFSIEDIDSLRNITEKNTFPFREFSFKLYFGINEVRTYFGFTNLNFFDKNPFNHRNQIRYIGVVFDIDQFFYRKKHKEKF